MTDTLALGPLTLASGTTLPAVEVAYVTHGTLNADGTNAILVTHGYTSGPSMLSPGHHVAESSWAPLLGPGRPLDTDRYFIVCSNMLGSSFGTTGPRSTNPATGQPYGPHFPAITLSDVVEVQHRLLQRLGVRHLRAVVGPSYGGWQALQWALDHPRMVDAIGVIVSGLRHPEGLGAEATRARLATMPGWNGGWLYDAQGAPTGMRESMVAQRLQTLQNYGLEQLFADRIADPAERRAAMEKPCREWAERFDPNSLVTLAGAAEHFDVRARVDAIHARTLFVICSTDKVFPPDTETPRLLDRVQAPVRYLELDSPYGHMASGVEWRRLEGELRWMLDETTVPA